MKLAAGDELGRRAVRRQADGEATQLRVVDSLYSADVCALSWAASPRLDRECCAAAAGGGHLRHAAVPRAVPAAVQLAACRQLIAGASAGCTGASPSLGGAGAGPAARSRRSAAPPPPPRGPRTAAARASSGGTSGEDADADPDGEQPRRPGLPAADAARGPVQPAAQPVGCAAAGGGWCAVGLASTC